MSEENNNNNNTNDDKDNRLLSGIEALNKNLEKFTKIFSDDKKKDDPITPPVPNKIKVDLPKENDDNKPPVQEPSEPPKPEKKSKSLIERFWYG